MKEVLLDEEGHNEFAQWILDLSYNTKQLQSLNEGLQATYDCVNCVTAAGLTGP